MTPHDRALELLALAREDEQAASVLDSADMSDGPVGFHYQQAVEKLPLECADAASCSDHLAKAYEAALSGRYLWHEFGDVHLIL